MLLKQKKVPPGRSYAAFHLWGLQKTSKRTMVCWHLMTTRGQQTAAILAIPMLRGKVSYFTVNVRRVLGTSVNIHEHWTEDWRDYAYRAERVRPLTGVHEAQPTATLPPLLSSITSLSGKTRAGTTDSFTLNAKCNYSLTLIATLEVIFAFLQRH